jgi:hypothetical protein
MVRTKEVELCSVLLVMDMPSALFACIASEAVGVDRLSASTMAMVLAAVDVILSYKETEWIYIGVIQQ